jgi:hypothetical protein
MCIFMYEKLSNILWDNFDKCAIQSYMFMFRTGNFVLKERLLCFSGKTA